MSLGACIVCFRQPLHMHWWIYFGPDYNEGLKWTTVPHHLVDFQNCRTLSCAWNYFTPPTLQHLLYHRCSTFCRLQQNVPLYGTRHRKLSSTPTRFRTGLEGFTTFYLILRLLPFPLVWFLMTTTYPWLACASILSIINRTLALHLNVSSLQMHWLKHWKSSNSATWPSTSLVSFAVVYWGPC